MTILDPKTGLKVDLHTGAVLRATGPGADTHGVGGAKRTGQDAEGATRGPGAGSGKPATR